MGIRRRQCEPCRPFPVEACHCRWVSWPAVTPARTEKPPARILKKRDSRDAPVAIFQESW
jgi:hypothetical protein